MLTYGSLSACLSLPIEIGQPSLKAAMHLADIVSSALLSSRRVL